MKRLYVHPIFRGCKLGKTLVERVIEVARRLGYSRLRLDTHPDSMQSAVELYRRFGFEEVPADPVPQRRWALLHGIAIVSMPPP